MKKTAGIKLLLFFNNQRFQTYFCSMSKLNKTLSTFPYTEVFRIFHVLVYFMSVPVCKLREILPLPLCCQKMQHGAVCWNCAPNVTGDVPPLLRWEGLPKPTGSSNSRNVSVQSAVNIRVQTGTPKPHPLLGCAQTHLVMIDDWRDVLWAGLEHRGSSAHQIKFSVTNVKLLQRSEICRLSWSLDTFTQKEKRKNPK